MLTREYQKPGALLFFPRATPANEIPKLYEVFEVLDKPTAYKLRCREIDLSGGAPTGPFMNLDPCYCLTYAQGMGVVAGKAAKARRRVDREKMQLDRLEGYALCCRGFAVDHFNNGAGHGGPYDA